MRPANNAEYTRLSKECQVHLRAGLLDWYSADLKNMAKILESEHKYKDMAKTLMIAFYIDLSGVPVKPFVDQASIRSLMGAVQNSGMNIYDMRGLYLDAVRPDTTPRHIMSVSDSMYVLELALSERFPEVSVIIDRFSLNGRVE